MEVEGGDSMESSHTEKKDIIKILEEQGGNDPILAIGDELLSRENRDLRSLSTEEQYNIIIDKVGKYENSVIPDAVLTPNELRLKYNSIGVENLEEIKPYNELYSKLLRSKLSGEPLSVKVGVDPTAGQIHMGHGITLRMMRRFQQMGHRIQFIIGDATAMVGDSTDRMTARQALTKDQVDANMENYTAQASRIIDISPNNSNVEVYHNSEWLNKSMMEWLPILQRISASRSMDRRDFQTRIRKGGSVSLGELMYSTFMAYDSVHLKSDVEIGGLDQYLNFLQTRDLMSKYNLEPETVVTVDLLPGTTGATDEQGRLVKMSKSLGNYIALDEEPVALYTKVMSIPDSLLPIWFRELTEISSLELQELLLHVASKDINPNGYEKATIDPVELKRMLARVVVASLNSGNMEIAFQAEKGSIDLVGKDSKLRPDNADIISVKDGTSVIEFLEEMGKRDSRLSSRTKIRNLINQNGISYLSGNEEDESYHGATMDILEESVTDGMYVKIGKKATFKVKIDDTEKSS